MLKQTVSIANACCRGPWWLLGVLLLLSGCSSFWDDTSDFERDRATAGSFSDVIAASGGSAELKGQNFLGFQDAGWNIDLSGATITDELITVIIEAYAKDPVFKLALGKSTITDGQLEKLDEAKVLQKVFVMDLSDTGISDAGLDKLDNMHCLTDLNLLGSKATADGGKRLGARKIASPDTPKLMKSRPKVKI